MDDTEQAQHEIMGSLRNESDLLVFISSVIEELRDSRQVAKQAVDDFPGTRPWLFEDMPASSESPSDLYLRKVRESDIVIWLVGEETSPPVTAEINTCMGAEIKLLSFHLPFDKRDTNTEKLIADAQDYATWNVVADRDKLAEHIKDALSDELVRAFRNPAPPTRNLRLKQSRSLSVSRIRDMLLSLDVEDGIATSMAEDRSVGDVLEFPNSGVHIVVGDQGSGKTLAVERLLQRAVDQAIDDSAQPMPFFVKARSLNEPLNEYADRMSQGAGISFTQGTFIAIDGIDEVGVHRANTLLKEARVYAGAYAEATVVLTTRPLPGLDLENIGKRIDMPLLNNEEAIGLLARVAGREIKPSAMFELMPDWSASIGKVSRHPLFAVMIGIEIRDSTELAIHLPSQLVSRLAQRALGRSDGSEEIVYGLLKALATKAISSGAQVPKASVSSSPYDLKLLNDSRLVTEDDGKLDFTLPIFREWFAARALIEESIVIEDVLPVSDRWFMPLSIAIVAENREFSRSLMSRLASSDPGMASLLLEEPSNNWLADDADAPVLNTAIEAGEEIYDAMESWRLGVGSLYSEIGPVGRDGRTASLGINLLGRNRIKRSWYWGGDNLPNVVADVPLQNSPNLDWPTITTQSLPKSPIWPWLMTRDILVESLSRELKAKRLALISEVALSELVWEFSLVGNLGGDLEGLLSVIRNILQSLASESVGFQFRASSGDTIRLTVGDLRRIEKHLDKLAGRGECLVSEPWPLPDRPMGSGWKWERYSGEQLLKRTNSVYSSALRIYQNMAEHWFGNFCNRLGLYRLLPVRLEGNLALPGAYDDIRLGPGLTWRSRSLHVGENSFAAFTLGDQNGAIDDRMSYFEDEANRLKTLRPESDVEYSLSVVLTVLDVFGFLPATELATRWLNDDLREVGWSKHM